MRPTFSENAWEDYLYWQKSDKAVVERIHLLTQDMQRNPFSGLGKPEALGFQFSGYYSRKITSEYRIVHRIAEGDMGMSDYLRNRSCYHSSSVLKSL
ncbi:MAG TPA: Txe/YoeB family addiction module toxin [Synergistaceae bacterium]|nr:Txe/YoeB family addiction module toxin [Synergistaceae bacterium]HPJ26420.1 Txe/YoeB family addiction module toxin [Synergistaceae bacterium]HPQ37672.1 Txe/YoeB family addiction module toxin [Synergistaceae bacterium]